MTYYNTTNENNPQLRSSWIQTAKQDDLIYQMFIWNHQQGFSPEDIELRCTDLGKTWPITSIRRAFSTLTKAGKLTKTNELQISSYGKNTHIWRLNENTRQNS